MFKVLYFNNNNFPPLHFCQVCSQLSLGEWPLPAQHLPDPAVAPTGLSRERLRGGAAAAPYRYWDQSH
jgi:hypothetical protein